MKHRHKRKRRRSPSDTKETPRPSEVDSSGSSGSSGGASRGSMRTWFDSNRSDLRFLLVFGALMAVYYFATTTSFAKETFFPWYLRETAQLSGRLLTGFGYDGLRVDGNVMSATGSSITVERGCDAIAPTALFVAAVVASPTTWLSKLPAVIGGTLLLMLLNLARIVTLFLTRIHWPDAFDVMHVDVWQAMFIFGAILLWAVWAAWTTRRGRTLTDAAT